MTKANLPLLLLMLSTPLAPLAARAEAPTTSGSWSQLPALPSPLSGHFAGESDGALIIAGGSDFPIPLLEGGTKKWFADIRVLPARSTQWVNASALPQAMGYGASVSDGQGLLCIGGGDAQTHTNAVFRLEWGDGKLCRTELPSLPKAVAYGSAAKLGNTIYVAGGQEAATSTEALNILWALDLKNPRAGWQQLPPCPGGGRILPAMAAQDGAIFLFSGASLAPNAEGKAVRTYLKDGWRFEPKTGWKAVAAPPRPFVAAPTSTDGKNRVLVFGGDDGSLASQTAQLKDKHPGFSHDVLAYDTRRDTWTKISTIPVGLVTTNAFKMGRDIVIPGGEDRPGHRNPVVLRFSPSK